MFLYEWGGTSYIFIFNNILSLNDCINRCIIVGGNDNEDKENQVDWSLFTDDAAEVAGTISDTSDLVLRSVKLTRNALEQRASYQGLAAWMGEPHAKKVNRAVKVSKKLPTSSTLEAIEWAMLPVSVISEVQMDYSCLREMGIIGKKFKNDAVVMGAFAYKAYLKFTLEDSLAEKVFDFAARARYRFFNKKGKARVAEMARFAVNSKQYKHAERWLNRGVEMVKQKASWAPSYKYNAAYAAAYGLHMVFSPDTWVYVGYQGAAMANAAIWSVTGQTAYWKHAQARQALANQQAGRLLEESIDFYSTPGQIAGLALNGVGYGLSKAAQWARHKSQQFRYSGMDITATILDHADSAFSSSGDLLSGAGQFCEDNAFWVSAAMQNPAVVAGAITTGVAGATCVGTTIVANAPLALGAGLLLASVQPLYGNEVAGQRL